MKPSLPLAPEKYSLMSTTGPFASLIAAASKRRRPAFNDISNQAKDPKVVQKQGEPPQVKGSLTVDDSKPNVIPSIKSQQKLEHKRKAGETDLPAPKSEVPKTSHASLGPAALSKSRTQRKAADADDEAYASKRPKFPGINGPKQEDKYLKLPR